MKPAVDACSFPRISPQYMAGYLGISLSTFQYWRDQLDPQPKRRYFVYSDLLTYRSLKLFIQRRHLTVQLLRELNFQGLFDWWRQMPLDKAVKLVLIADERNYCWRTEPLSKPLDATDLFLHAIPLLHVINENTVSFYTLGLKSSDIEKLNVDAVVSFGGNLKRLPVRTPRRAAHPS